VLAALSTISFTALSKNNYNDIEELRLVVDGVQIKGLQDDKMHFANFDTFLKLKALIEDISKSPSEGSNNEDTLLKFEVSFHNKSSDDNIIKFSKNYMLDNNQAYFVSETQFKELQRLLLLRMTKKELNTLTEIRKF
tara:strand:- start:37 stop:447 length:411 start_codon:yes stop_codon:yes gene_type:complete